MLLLFLPIFTSCCYAMLGLYWWYICSCFVCQQIVRIDLHTYFFFPSSSCRSPLLDMGLPSLKIIMTSAMVVVTFSALSVPVEMPRKAVCELTLASGREAHQRDQEWGKLADATGAHRSWNELTLVNMALWETNFWNFMSEEGYRFINDISSSCLPIDNRFF